MAAVLVAAWVLAGCGEDERRSGAPPAHAPSREVRFRAPDGLQLQGTLAAPGDAKPAVALVNTSNTAGPRFDALAAELNSAGFTTLSFTARAKFTSLRDVTAENNERTVSLDVTGAVRFLRRAPEADPRRIGLFAQSMGAAAVLYAAGTRDAPRVAATVGLSPPDSADIFRFQTAGRYRLHDALLIADEVELINSQNLVDGARRSEVWKAPIRGHGAALLPDERVRSRILDWFRDRLG